LGVRKKKKKKREKKEGPPSKLVFFFEKVPKKKRHRAGVWGGLKIYLEKRKFFVLKTHERITAAKKELPQISPPPQLKKND